MSCLSAIRDEFRLQNFGLRGFRTERFFSFQWRVPTIVYLIYRLALAVYSVTILGITASNYSANMTLPWGAFLTNWTYSALTTYLVTHCVIAFVYHLLYSREYGAIIFGVDEETHKAYFINENDYVEERMRRVLSVIVWTMFSIVSAAALMVTVMFWSTIYPTLSGDGTSSDNIQLHAVNSVIVLLEHALTGIPNRILHVAFPIQYGIVYVIFSAIYWSGDHKRVMYPILDWNNAGPTTGWVFLIGFVVIPCLHLFFHGVYRIKSYLFDIVYRHSSYTRIG